MWRGLADPPEVVFGHYVVGDKLFVIGVLGLYCYNFFSNKWTKADEARRSFKCTPILEPKGAICLRGLQFGPDFHVMINVQEGDKGDTVVTYAMVLNKNGLLLCSQELGQIFSGIRIGMVEHFFFDLGWEEGGNKRICAVLTGFGYDVQSQPIVCVSIFNLRKLDKVELADLADPPVIPSDGFSSYELPTKTILQVTVIRQRVCVLSKHMPDPFIGDAFLF